MSESTSGKNSNGIYHVLVRVTQRQNLFYEKEDFRACQRIILKTKEKYGFLLYAYCMMNNYMHLLVQCKMTDLSVVMQGIFSLYAVYFDKRYGKTGRVFRGRFRSEAIESDDCFAAVLAYIHGKPCRAGMAERMEDYPYSSYREYVRELPGMTDTEQVLTQTGREEFIGLHDRELKRPPAVTGQAERTEEEAFLLFCEKTNSAGPEAFHRMNPILQRSCVLKLRQQNVTYAQIARITGIPYEHIRYLGNMK